jgi:hypothetical protein
VAIAIQSVRDNAEGAKEHVSTLCSHRTLYSTFPEASSGNDNDKCCKKMTAVRIDRASGDFCGLWEFGTSNNTTFYLFTPAAFSYLF